jgi:hypothetical protein
MNGFNRRSFLGASLGAVSLLRDPAAAFAQTACVTSGWPPFMPSSLSVDCASRRNFLNFRRNSSYMGLAGAVSMSYAKGKWGAYPAGNLFLFPWLKKAGQALGATKDWGVVMPTSTTRYMSAAPIPKWTMPLDEYFCRYRIETDWTMFIGFRVDLPFGINDARRPWYTNVAKLADGKPVGIGWTSDNLNAPWFGGSQWIPDGDTCNGAAWRKIVIAALSTASSGVC